MHMLLMRIKDGVFDPTTGTPAIKTKVNAVFDRIGAPAGASIAADLAAIKAAADTISALVDPEVATILANSATLIADVEPEVAQIKTSTDRIGVPAGASVSADVAAVKADTSSIGTRIGVPAGASVSADVAAVKADTTAIKGFVDTEVAAIKTETDKLGAPVGASHSADTAAVKADTAAIKTATDRIGVPAGASMSADIASIQADTTSIKGFVDTEVGVIQSAVDSRNVTIWPQLANEVVVIGAAGAWALGVLAQVIAAAQVAQSYNVDTVYLLATSAAFSGGELVLYHGVGDTEFARVAIHNGGAAMPIPLPSSKRIPANDQVRVALATKAGAAEIASVKLGVHYG